ncbi:MAG TPA: PQQ-binding-like beta-propeller repeat protein [Gaiellales bacterium]|jgi:glucose dehydrogenase|nr:PQQ-binding-like beta-propeller repeat protein [Gaiellales bacterium]
MSNVNPQVTAMPSRRKMLVAGVAVLAAVSAVAVAGVSVASGRSAKNGAAQAGEWPLPGADLANTRNVPGPIKSSNVTKLKKAWSVPIRATGSFGTYATTPIVVGGVVYTQDINSNVYAINLKTGKVNWFKKYNLPSEGPNGVNVVNGVVYGATGDSAFALQASTGEQLWIKKLTRNKNEGIDMAPGVNNGAVYISTVPGNAKGFYAGNGQAILWALNAKTGATMWKWEEVPKDLWSKAHTNINSGGGQWDPPSFDAAGDLYLGVSNPAPWPGAKGFPFGSSRPGPNLYTDSIVKLDHKTGKLQWFYQLTSHDIYDWDLENSPILTQANGKNVVIDAGKGGIVVAVDQATGKLLWKTPVGTHNGHDNDHLLTLAQQKKKLKFPYKVFPGALGGVESQLASDGTNVYAAVNNLASTFTNETEAGLKFETPFNKGTGDFVALNQATGKIVWDHKFSQSPYGAASLTNDVAFTTTYDGTVWALSTKTGKVLWSAKLPAGTNTPVTIAGDTVITAGSFPQSKTQKSTIVAYRLGS